MNYGKLRTTDLDQAMPRIHIAGTTATTRLEVSANNFNITTVNKHLRPKIYVVKKQAISIR
jgi:hypothetical protein